MSFPYTFSSFQFARDFEDYVNKKSLRTVSEELNGTISPSTLHRITSGKKRDLSVQELCLICHLMDKKPTEYIQKTLF